MSGIASYRVAGAFVVRGEGLVKIELLGPMRLTVAGRPVEVTAPRVRTLLAALAMAAGESVPIDRLAAAMWDGRLPADTRKAVQLYVVRLRAQLDAGLIETTPAGYLLHAVPDDVDALRFVRVLDVAAADPTAERDRLVEALSLWRGMPFEDVGSRWLEVSSAPRLVERYLAGTERRIDLDLSDGRARELVAELAELTIRHPLRESLWVRRLMVLDRCGRRAEALALYESVRSRLAEQLGTDPGPELQSVHADLLAGRTPEPTRTPEHGALRVPQQLPADVGGFTGRDASLRWLDEQFAGRPVLCAIAGAAGIGKSALAIHAVHRHAVQFPDGQLYVDLQGATPGLRPVQPLEVLGRFLRALGMEARPADLHEASAAFRTRVAGRRLLVVLDNAADSAQVRPLLPAGTGCGVLVTSRTVLSGIEGACHLHLDLLANAEAIELLGHVAGPARIAAEPGAAADVVRSCASLPLAVRIAGARLAARPTWPVRALADRLADARRRLDELETAEAGARSSFAVSLEQARDSPAAVDRAAAEAFEVLGILDGPELDADVVARLLDQSPATAERALERLVDLQLLETPSPGRYRLHDLLRLYARELAERHPAELREAALTRVLAFYVATAWQTLKLLRPGDYRLERIDPGLRTGGMSFDDDQAALRWLDAERANLVPAVRQASGFAPTAPAAVQLAHALYGFFLLRGHWSDWERVGGITLTVTRATGDLAGQAQVHNDLGVRHLRLGQYEEALACLRESLSIRRRLGDRPGQAAGLVNFGLVHQALGNYDEALVCGQESLAISRSIEDTRGVAAGLNNLGDVYQWQGRYDEALACLAESLAMGRQMGDRKLQAIALNNLGALHERQGRHAQAVEVQRRSLAIYRDLGDREGEAFCLTELGVTLRDRGRIDQARGHWQQALAIFERLRTDPGRVRTLLADLPADLPTAPTTGGPEGGRRGGTS
jgi:DNA-binding SARP family transcriptional activator/tetratricopeptide (TPR) repeat protein